jgi:hypothetical protein
MDSLIKKVWDFVPVPTEEGARQIAEAERTLTDPTQAATVDKWVAVALENKDLLLEKLQKKHLLRKAPSQEEPVPPEIEKMFEREDMDPFGSIPR